MASHQPEPAAFVLLAFLVLLPFSTERAVGQFLGPLATAVFACPVVGVAGWVRA